MNTEDFPTAGQMRKGRVSLERQAIDNQLTRLKKDLLETPNTGFLKIDYPLHAIVVQTLRDLGYTVSNTSQDGNHSFTISW